MTDKRTWWYVKPPSHFEVAPCSCGNSDIQWSEFKKHCWCKICQKDFIPEHWGILDGAIPLETSQIMGVCFDRFNTETNKVEIFDIQNGEWV